MNYKLMAAAIRKERFMMWDDIGRPYPLVRMVKGRQGAMTWGWRIIAYVPWSDQWLAFKTLEYAKKMFFGTRPTLRDENHFQTMNAATSGLISQIGPI